MGVLRIPSDIYAGIRAHGEKTYPQECCGALLGRCGQEGWQVMTSVQAENIRTGSAQNRYQIAPMDLVRIEREAHQNGLEIAGFYHSHPDHAAQWSQTDFAEAHWTGCVYVITEVAQGKAADTNAFLLTGTGEKDKRFEQLSLQVENEGGE